MIEPGNAARWVQRFLGDRRGVAALEFAIVAPLLLSIYIVTMEVSQGIETSKKAARVASMTADLVTQQQKTTKAELDAIMRIGKAILQPYNRSDPTIDITAIEITDETTPQVKVVWSRRLVGDEVSSGAAKGSAATIPETLKIKGTVLIRVASTLDYRPVTFWTAEQKAKLGLAAAFDDIAMGESYHLRPRVSNAIPCADC